MMAKKQIRRPSPPSSHGGDVLNHDLVPQPGHPSTKLYANPAGPQAGLSVDDMESNYA